MKIKCKKRKEQKSQRTGNPKFLNNKKFFKIDYYKALKIIYLNVALWNKQDQMKFEKKSEKQRKEKRKSKLF